MIRGMDEGVERAVVGLSGGARCALNPDRYRAAHPHTLSPLSLSLSVTRTPVSVARTYTNVYVHTRRCCRFVYITLRTYYTRIYIYAYMPDLPQRESHCAAGECLLFSRLRATAVATP